MELRVSTRVGCVIVSFAGRIDLLSVSTVQRTLLKELSREPDGLVCDLSGVGHLDPVCATVFATVINHPSSRWPATSFALCNAQQQVADLLNRLQVPDFLPVHATLEAALDAIAVRPPYLRDELPLAPNLSAPAVARAFVGTPASPGSSPNPTIPGWSGRCCWPTSW